MAQFTDAFTRSNSTNIASGAPVSWTEREFGGASTTTWEIVSNQLRATSGSTYVAAIAGDSGSGDCYAECLIGTGVNVGTIQIGPAVRMDSTATNGWYLSAWSDRLRLYQVDTGTLTTRDDFNSGVNHAGKVVRLEAVGDTLEVFVDGVSKGTYTSTAHQSNQYVGIGGRNSALADDFDGGSILEVHTISSVAVATSVASDAFAETHTKNYYVDVATSVTSDAFAVTMESTRDGQAIAVSEAEEGLFTVGYEHRWAIPTVEYFDTFVSLGDLPIQTEGGVLASAIRVIGPDGRAVYSTLDETGVTKLAMEMGTLKEVVDGIATRSADLSVWFDADPGSLPEHAPSNLDHPLRSWSGALVEIYSGWQVQTETYRFDNYLARRATLAVGRCRWTLGEAGHQVTANLVDLRSMLGDDLDEGWTIASGTLSSDGLVALVEDRFGGDIIINVGETEADSVLPLMTIEPGESRLRVIEEIENSTGWMVSFDPFGRCLIAQQLEVFVRSEPIYHFGNAAAGELAVVAPVENLFSQGAPSGAEIKVSSVNDEDDEVVVLVWDSDPASPTYWQEGQEAGLVQPLVKKITTECYCDVYPDNFSATRAAWMALRRYGRGGGDCFSFNTVPVPQILGGDPVSLYLPQMGLDEAWFTVEEIDLPLRPGPMRVVVRPSWDPTNGAGET